MSILCDKIQIALKVFFIQTELMSIIDLYIYMFYYICPKFIKLYNFIYSSKYCYFAKFGEGQYYVYIYIIIYSEQLVPSWCHLLWQLLCKSANNLLCFIKKKTLLILSCKTMDNINTQDYPSNYQLCCKGFMFNSKVAGHQMSLQHNLKSGH